MDSLILSLAFLFVGALAAGLITYLIARSNTRRRLEDNDKLWNERLTAKQQLAKQAEHMADERLVEQKARADQEINTLKATHEKMIQDLNEQHERALHEQINLLKAEMKAETEALLKAREEELSKGNRTNIDAILTPLKESIDKMQNAMDSNAREHLKSNTELRSQLEQAVKEMQERTTDIGSKADNLSLALTGKAKM